MLALAGGKNLDQPIDERDLRRLQPPACLVGSEPCHAVELGKDLAATTSWRPLHLELVRVGVGWVQVTLDGPGVDDLAALLDDRAEGNRRSPVRLRGGRRQPGLLGELAAGHREEVSIHAVRLTLRDGPVTLVAAGEERPAGMTEEELG